MKKLLRLATTLLIAKTSLAQPPQPINLYQDGAPGAKPAPATYTEKEDKGHVSHVVNPELIPFFPASGKANGTAVIICPGGGYAFLSIQKEGYEVARKYNEAGVTAFVLKYRLPSNLIMTDKSIAPLQDAQRAIQIVRQRAAEWHIRPYRVGIIGFSAGGHLASTVGTHFGKAYIANPGNISLRPDFMMLLYPVISFAEFAHQGSRINLVGKNPDTALVNFFSNEKQVTPQTPPTFLVQAQDDPTVPVQNSLLFYQALTKAGVKAEMHLYPGGGHGFGLNNKTTTDQWFDRCITWMTDSGWMGSAVQ